MKAQLNRTEERRKALSKCTLSVGGKCLIALYRWKISQNAIWRVAISTRRTNIRVFKITHCKVASREVEINKNVLFTSGNYLMKLLRAYKCRTIYFEDEILF